MSSGKEKSSAHHLVLSFTGGLLLCHSTGSHDEKYEKYKRILSSHNVYFYDCALEWTVKKRFTKDEISSSLLRARNSNGRKMNKTFREKNVTFEGIASLYNYNFNKSNYFLMM